VEYGLRQRHLQLKQPKTLHPKPSQTKAKSKQERDYEYEIESLRKIAALLKRGSRTEE
jgi:hypothetical protein